jgi:hypothetical protein
MFFQQYVLHEVLCNDLAGSVGCNAFIPEPFGMHEDHWSPGALSQAFGTNGVNFVVEVIFGKMCS